MQKDYFVYAISGSGMTKVGISNNPLKRLKFMQINCPVPLTLLGAIKYSSLTEALLAEKGFHEMFAKTHAYGEWFKIPPEILAKSMPLAAIEQPAPRFKDDPRANQLNKWRERMGFTIMEAAAVLGVPKNHMIGYAFECRRVPPKILRKCFNLEIDAR